MSPNTDSPMGRLGLEDHHLITYRALLGRGPLTVTQLAHLTGPGKSDLRARLRWLAGHGAVL